MRLLLNNFGCYERREFVFLDEGTILLSAPSGQGKTTIIRAILFALYGTKHMMIRYGATKCSVDLWFREIHIRRSNKPNRLIVNETIEDDEAQNLINQIIHSKNDFSQNSFISMTPANKLQFLENIMFSDIDAVKLKSNIDASRKEIELILNKLECESNTVSLLLKEIPTKEKVDAPIFEFNIFTGDIIDIQYIRTEIVKTEDEIRTIQTMISQREKYKSEIASFEREKNVLTDRRVELELDLNSTQSDSQSSDYSSIENQIQVCNNYIRYCTLKDELDSESFFTLDSRLDELETEIQTKQSINGKHFIAWKNRLEEYLDLKKSLDNLLTFEHDVNYYESLIAQSNSIRVECPKCKSDLCLRDNQLYVGEIIEANQSQLSKWRELIRTIQRNEDKKRGIESRLETLHSSIESFDMEYLTAKVKEYESNREELVRLTERQKGLNQTLNRLQKKKQEYDRLQSSSSQFSSVNEALTSKRQLEERLGSLRATQTRRNGLMTKLDSINTSIESVERKISQVQNALDNIRVIPIEYTGELETKLSLLKKGLSQAVDYNSYIEMKRLSDKYNLQLVQNRQDTKKNESKLKAIMRFNEKISEAETIALSHLVQTLNTHIQMYLDIFFEKEPLQARIECTKQVKDPKAKIKVKNEINISITYKGNSVDLKSLSAGEYDRVALAISLSIQTLLNNPILLLDECVSSLDQENADIVFQCIREFHKDKLTIVVAHQIVTGIFDQVIQL